MKKFAVVLVALVAAWLWWRPSSLSDPASGLSFDYRVDYTGDASGGDTLPMLIALHGNGDKPQHFFDTALSDVKQPARVVLLRGPISYRGGGAWPLRANELTKQGDALAGVIAELQKKYPTRGRPILFGFSGGAVMTYYQAYAHPQQLSVAVPVSGRLPDEILARAASPACQGLRVMAFHGGSDSVIFIGDGQKALDALAAAGAQTQMVKLDGGHVAIFEAGKPAISAALDQVLGQASTL